jgi:hypothetical protein
MIERDGAGGGVMVYTMSGARGSIYRNVRCLLLFRGGWHVEGSADVEASISTSGRFTRHIKTPILANTTRYHLQPQCTTSLAPRITDEHVLNTTCSIKYILLRLE